MPCYPVGKGAVNNQDAAATAAVGGAIASSSSAPAPASSASASLGEQRLKVPGSGGESGGEQ